MGTSYIVKRPRGLKVQGETIPSGTILTAEQIGQPRVIASLVSMGWIKEVSLAAIPIATSQQTSAGSESQKRGGRPRKKPT